MNTHHPKLNALGWNQRVLTYEIFERFCEREGILILNAALECPSPGFFRIHRGWPVIAIDQQLRGVKRNLVAWHEVGHYLLHTPGHFGWHAKTELQADVVAHIALIPAVLIRSCTPAEIAEEYGYTQEMIWTRLEILRRFHK